MPDVTHLQIASIWIDVSIREEHSRGAEVTQHPVEEGADVTDHVRLQAPTLQIEGVVTNTPIEQPGSHADGATASNAGITLQKYGGGDLEIMRASGTQSIEIEGEPTLGALGIVPGIDQAASLVREVGVDVRARRRLQMIVPKETLGPAPKHAIGLVFDKPFDRVRAVYNALVATFEARRPVQIVTGLAVYEQVVLTDLSINREASTAGTLHFGCTGQVLRIVKNAKGLVGAPDPIVPRGKPAVNLGNQAPQPVAASDPAAQQVSTYKQIKDAVGAAVTSFLHGS